MFFFLGRFVIMIWPDPGDAPMGLHCSRANQGTVHGISEGERAAACLVDRGLGPLYCVSGTYEPASISEIPPRGTGVGRRMGFGGGDHRYTRAINAGYGREFFL